VVGDKEGVSEEPSIFCLAASAHFCFQWLHHRSRACVFCIIADGLLSTNTHLGSIMNAWLIDARHSSTCVHCWHLAWLPFQGVQLDYRNKRLGGMIRSIDRWRKLLLASWSPAGRARADSVIRPKEAGSRGTSNEGVGRQKAPTLSAVSAPARRGGAVRW
jgi:hypothetical protein